MRITNLLPLFINKYRVADIHLCWYPLRLVPDCTNYLKLVGTYIHMGTKFLLLQLCSVTLLKCFMSFMTLNYEDLLSKFVCLWDFLYLT